MRVATIWGWLLSLSLSSRWGHYSTAATTMFMLIECMIQLPQEIHIIMETTACNYFLWIQLAQLVLWWGYCTCSNHVPHVKLRLLLDIKPFWKLRSHSLSPDLLLCQIASVVCRSWSRVTNLHSGLTLAGTVLNPTARASGLRSRFSGIT